MGLILTACAALTQSASLASEPHRLPSGRYGLGDPAAPVVVTEYADFQCPGCQNFVEYDKASFLIELKQLGNVRFEYADFPLPLHRNAVAAASAARCVQDPALFWTFHDALYARQQEWRLQSPAEATQTFLRMAQELKVPSHQFWICQTTGREAQFVQADARRSRAKGVRATPSFAVNGQLISWDGVEDIEAMVQKTLAIARTAAQQAD